MLCSDDGSTVKRMKKPLPIGISDFKTLIDGGYVYVDKTLWIQEVIEKGTHVALIPRPRRFGKTLNLSMLRYFFEKGEEDTSYLFKGLKIWEILQHVHRFYPKLALRRLER